MLLNGYIIIKVCKIYNKSQKSMYFQAQLHAEGDACAGCFTPGPCRIETEYLCQVLVVFALNFHFKKTTATSDD